MGGALRKYTQNKQESTDQQMAENDQTEEDKTNSIPISNFKSNKLSHIDKKTRAEDFEKMMANSEPYSPMIHDAIRLPNKASSTLKDAGEHKV